MYIQVGVALTPAHACRPPLGQSLQLLAESSAEFGPFNHLKGCKW